MFAQSYVLHGRAIDFAGKPISSVEVRVESHAKVLSDNEGAFKVSLKEKPLMPFKVTAVKEGYQLSNFSFFEGKDLLEVKLKKESTIQTIKRKIAPTIEREQKDSNGVSPIPVPSAVQDTIVLSANDSIEVHSKVVLNKYKEDFTRISDEILKEKVRLERKNFEISKEINEITNRLRSEKSINVKQREELQKYLVSLQAALNDNQMAFLRAEERTQGLIFKLKKIILQKDSINLIAKQKMLVVEKDKKALEKKFRRNLIVFSIVTFILILFALVFYLIAEKFKKQKKQIQGVNTELEAVKNDLELHVEEVDRQKEQIEEKNKQLDAFVYKASHDIKGPLKSVIGLTKVGIQTITDPESVEIFNHILKSTTKLDNLVLDLLTLSKSKQSTLVKVNINLLNMVEEVLLSFSHSEAFAKMHFEKNIDMNLTFFSDERLLYSIVQNFIENGIKYRDNDKPTNVLKITMSETPNSELKMVFEDNGIGIDDIHKDKIFDMFYKVNEKSNGTGLGLHIVKMNIEKLGGVVSLESESGKGSIFTLLFNKSN